MGDRYIPKGGNGGAREGAGRPPGSINGLSKEAIRQGNLLGELPHMLLLRWAQTGVMESVEEEYRMRVVPDDSQAVDKDGKPTGKKNKTTYKTKRIAVPKRDANGNYIKREQILAPQLRMLMAQSILQHFAPKLTDKKVDLMPEQQAAQEKADAEFFEAAAMRDMPEGKLN